MAIAAGAFFLGQSPLAAKKPSAPQQGRIVHASVVALDHLLVYNRFGSFNPFGMMFALQRDVSNISSLRADKLERPVAEECAKLLGTEAGTGELRPAEVILKACKRPRPLVLRANVGDILEVTVTNLLRREWPDISGDQTGSTSSIPPHFCDEHSTLGREPIRTDIRGRFEQSCRDEGTARSVVEAAATTDSVPPAEDPKLNGTGDWPRTRYLSFVIPGLEPLPVDGRIDRACLGTAGVEPGKSFTCRWSIKGEGTHLFSSFAAPAGGQADGGSLMHGLFGALIVEAQGSRAYRSQVTRAAFEEAWPSNPSGPAHARRKVSPGYDTAFDQRQQAIDLRTTRTEGNPCSVPGPLPVLAMERDCGRDAAGARHVEVVHGDLNAIIVPAVSGGDEESSSPDEDEVTVANLRRERDTPFREFTIVFHDELKTFYPDQLKELDEFDQLSGIRDAFAINYGASGAGSIVLAQRKKIGPAANCPECLYEEFFLQSWANGDPALLEAFPDDPSNVHHSYLNDKVVFRNLHAGKETHVFHLHTHQWFAGNDENRGAYLDSQTIAPQQGFTYRIYHGGLDRYRPTARLDDAPKGWWENLGSGNRNRTPGDAIFHCHLYPHFAQGMWALWRVHDVLEDGTRLLPDGQKVPGLSFEPLNAAEARAGSVAPDGRWLGIRAEGTPVPGLIPLPGFAAPLLPLYAERTGDDAMPGYPFYIAGRPGHRAPQPPLDMASNTAYKEAGLSSPVKDGVEPRPHLDGGLPRHIVTGGTAVPSVGPAPAGELVARMLALGDFTSKFEKLKIQLLPQEGTQVERGAMAFHHDGIVRDKSGERRLDLKNVLGHSVRSQKEGGYASPRVRGPAAGRPEARFTVNGAPPAPGAPFADPCGAPGTIAGLRYRAFDGESRFERRTFARLKDPFQQLADSQFVPDPGLAGFRRFDVSAVQIDMVVNRAGWHDPQARINVLSSLAEEAKGAGRIASATPFYFRAFSGECVEFRHTNELPKDLELDDFQLRVPTDTIGQHIHLVKFDVTSADGSGNGFNYEDGTFAPDEILERICKSQGNVEQDREVTGLVARRKEECAELERNPDGLKLYREKRIDGGNLDKAKYFQTSVQRWFADPILSNDGQGEIADRTLRTVFTHDHFAPSNIQQHGFYSALLIEPKSHAFCLGDGPEGKEWPSPAGPSATCVAGPGKTAPVSKVATDRQVDHVGARASVFAINKTDPLFGDPIHPDAREYALAIADFALLYDNDRAPSDPADRSPRGLDRLLAEATCRRIDRDDNGGDKLKSIPAVVARICRDGSTAGEHKDSVGKLAQRQQTIRERHGRPVSPPERPEAISQEHHDPYLVNYRHEPIPLRIGSRDGTRPAWASNRCGTDFQGGEGRSIRQQRQADGKVSPEGDMANMFRSFAEDVAHGDPCTPILEAYQNERVSVRLIQGAQEVQHLFRLEGGTFRRNTDQSFPAARPMATDRPSGLRAEQCHNHPVALYGRPREYVSWLTGKNPPNRYWDAYKALSARCDNVLGFTTAQEIGISEHFELGAFFRGDTAGVVSLFKALAPSNDAARGDELDPLDKPANDLNLFDYQYSFGTQDAKWNGAWGLVRIHAFDPEAHAEEMQARDLTKCLAEGQPTLEHANRCVQNSPDLTKRLRPFSKLRAEVGVQSQQPAPPPQVPRKPPVAIDERDLCRTIEAGGTPAIQVRAIVAAFPRPGMVYNRADRLFDPDALLLVGVEPGAVQLPSGGTAESLSAGRFRDLGEELAEPVKAAVKARLKLLEGRTPSPYVLRVNAGDCVTLKIVNLLPDRLSDKRGDALMPRIVPLNTDHTRSRRPDPREEAQPSTNVSLSVNVPLRMHGSNVPLPYGLNAKPAAAPGQVSTIRFYAGQIWFEDEKDPNQPARVRKAMPYAFGPLPIHAVADPIGQPTSGLVGTLIVEAEGSQSPEDRVEQHGTAILKMADGHAGMRASAAVSLPVVSFPSGAVAEAYRCLDPANPIACGADKPIAAATIQEHVLLWQDGLNLWTDRWEGGGREHPLPDCPDCGDSYDWGEQAVSYGSERFTDRLVNLRAADAGLGLRHYPEDRSNLNGFIFPFDFLSTRRVAATPTLFASPGEQVVVRITHPGGRARQHAFVLTGADYDDLYPAFGSAHSALLAPGKGITAAFCAPRAAEDYLWRNGPQHLFSRGMWGHLRVSPLPSDAPGSAISLCSR